MPDEQIFNSQEKENKGLNFLNNFLPYFLLLFIIASFLFILVDSIMNGVDGQSGLAFGFLLIVSFFIFFVLRFIFLFLIFLFKKNKKNQFKFIFKDIGKGVSISIKFIFFIFLFSMLIAVILSFTKFLGLTK